jgi:hypothetical protein
MGLFVDARIFRGMAKALRFEVTRPSRNWFCPFAWQSVYPGNPPGRAKNRSADWQSAVSRIGNPQPHQFRTLADCQSAIRQVANLRYMVHEKPRLTKLALSAESCWLFAFSPL